MRIIFVQQMNKMIEYQIIETQVLDSVSGQKNQLKNMQIPINIL